MGVLNIVSGGPETRYGRLELAGEVVDSEPVMPSGLRVVDAWVLSVLLHGEGLYRDADGREERLAAGAHTILPPGFPHRYGTGPGRRWTELFVVFSGPLFDAVAPLHGMDVPGPRYPRPAPPVDVLRTLLRATPSTGRAGEHQLLAFLDWLLDAEEAPGPSASGSGDGLSEEVARAVALLTEDLGARLDLRSVAAESGLTYDAFRRRFTRETGRTPSAFRTAHRLEAAASLLRLTDMTQRHIARTLGFADEFHLSRRFRAHFGVPPSTYRAH